MPTSQTDKRDSLDPEGTSQDPLSSSSDEGDEIIGLAFRRSLVVIGAVGALAAASYFLRGGDDAEEVIIDKDAGKIEDLRVDQEVLPAVVFTDVTAESGIDFVHQSGAVGDKLLPETMGGGGAFFDANGDGNQDLLLVSGRPWDAAPGQSFHRLYLGDGEGHFEDGTEGSGLSSDHYGMGVAVGDVNGDGWNDVFMTGVGGNRLFLNEGGAFTDVTEAAGVAGSPEDWTTSAGFFDMDGDQDLDLFVCHYVKWSRAIDDELSYTLNGNDRAYGPPMNYRGAFSSLYRNDGKGKFEDVSEAAGIQITNPATGAPMGKALGVSFADVDDDGDTDIFVANDTVQNHLFLNDGAGVFQEAGGETGFAFDRNGGSTGAMGIDVGDHRGDGTMAICIGNFANEMSSFYVKDDRRLRFTDDSIGEGIGSPSRSRLSFGLFFFDYDLDGRLDLLQVNGHLEESINEVQPSQTYLQRPQLFWNQGPTARRCFLEVPTGSAGALDQDLAGRGSAFADIDGDGDQDVLIMQVGRAPMLLRNDQSLGRHWLRVVLEQDGPNSAALGAQVRLTRQGKTLSRTVTATRSYLSQSELPVTFGLGDHADGWSLEVTWPDGTVDPRGEVSEVDRVMTASRPK